MCRWSSTSDQPPPNVNAGSPFVPGSAARTRSTDERARSQPRTATSDDRVRRPRPAWVAGGWQRWRATAGAEGAERAPRIEIHLTNQPGCGDVTGVTVASPGCWLILDPISITRIGDLGPASSDRTRAGHTGSPPQPRQRSTSAEHTAICVLRALQSRPARAAAAVRRRRPVVGCRRGDRMSDRDRRGPRHRGNRRAWAPSSSGRSPRPGARLGLVGTDGGRLAAVAATAGLADDRWAPGVGDVTDRDGGGGGGRRQVVAKLGPRRRAAPPRRGLRGRRAGSSRSMTTTFARCSTSISGRRSTWPGRSCRAWSSAGWGRVVAVSATTATTTPPGLGAYSVAQGRRRRRCCGRSRARSRGNGVTVNVLGRPQDRHRARARHGAVSQERGVDDAGGDGGAMLELCSDEAAATTGQRIAMDGST